MNVQDKYKDKLITLESAASLIEPGDNIALPPGVCEPNQLCTAIANRVRRGELAGITFENAYTVGLENEIWNSDLAGKVELELMFINPANRWSVDTKNSLKPIFYQDVPRMIKKRFNVPDIFLAEVSPMDKHGYFTLGASVSSSQTTIEHARKVIFVANKSQPRTFGNTFIHISKVDHIVECHHELLELPDSGTNEKAMIMAEFVADMIPNGSCLQIGVGKVPNAVASLLGSKRNLGIHTELFSESIIDLIESGAVDNSQKTINKGKSVYTFALGTKRLYDYLDDNPGVEGHEVDYTNDPANIAKNNNHISINATLQVDLTGQCCSESIGFKQYSGVGGQSDFCRGAYLSEGGKSIICVYSTAKNGTISTIVPFLNQGAIVSTPRTNIMYIVTEFGVATLINKTVSERAKELINISHPKFRAELESEARRMNLI